ncbi:MAG: hypothetical protein AB1646_04715 [Thermodesulfobacteriota bacterium]
MGTVRILGRGFVIEQWYGFRLLADRKQLLGRHGFRLLADRKQLQRYDYRLLADRKQLLGRHGFRLLADRKQLQRYGFRLLLSQHGSLEQQQQRLHPNGGIFERLVLSQEYPLAAIIRTLV